MPTNEERREVAARLRKKHGERQVTFEPQSISIQAMNRMDDLLDCLPKRRDMFLDLADLIEPEPERTCRVVKKTADIDGERMTDYTCCFNQPGWNNNFCPNCGAKVVE